MLFITYKVFLNKYGSTYQVYIYKIIITNHFSIRFSNFKCLQIIYFFIIVVINVIMLNVCRNRKNNNEILLWKFLILNQI